MTNAPIAADAAVVSLASELIARPSVTPDDAGCQSLIASRLEAAGFDCESMPAGGVSNLWARRGSASPLLCFAGHTDVVPPGPTAAWHSDPFEPVVRDGRLYGRGAADMKGGLAAMLVAAERFLADQPDFSGSIGFLVTSDEEGDARDGTRHVVDELRTRGVAIDWCVIGEPSSDSAAGDTIRIGRRGSLDGEIIIPGRPGHAAYPHQVDNPVAKLAPFLAALYDLDWGVGGDAFPATGFQVVEVAAGDGTWNVTPAEVRIRMNFRYSPQWSVERISERVDALLHERGFVFTSDWRDSGRPFLTADGKLLETVESAIEAICGRTPQRSTAGGTSDGRFIAPGGTEVVELGPVNRTIHQPNENVGVDELALLARVYERIMRELLT